MLAQFAPTHVVVLAELSAKEKERYFDILIYNNAKFYRDESGNYVTNVRLLAPGVNKISQQPQDSREEKKKSVSIEDRISRLDTMHDHINVSIEGVDPFDHSAYPKFVNVIASDGDIVQPRLKPLTWLMRIIEEVYDARYMQDTGIREEGDETSILGKADQSFPIFVAKYFCTRLGLRSIVEQQCWDILYNANHYRKAFLDVEVFARFLQEFYDVDDLLFFLYVRSVIQKLLNISFKSRWTKTDRSTVDRTVPSQSSPTIAQHHQQVTPPALFMTYKECMSVARTVFGSEDDPMCRAFLAMIENQIVGQKKNEKDTRRIDVSQYIHLAVVGYHETHPDEDDDGGGQMPQAGLNMPPSSMQSQPSFGTRTGYGFGSRHANTGSSGLTETSLAGLENAGRSGSNYAATDTLEQYAGPELNSGYMQDMSKDGGVGGGEHYDTSNFEGYIDSIAHNRAAIAEMEKGGGRGKSGSGHAQGGEAILDIAEAVNNLSPSIMDLIGKYENEYLIALTSSVSSLPEEFLSEIREEISTELHRRVLNLLTMMPDAVVSNNESAIAEAMTIILASDELTQEVEPLLGLYVQYVTDRINSQDGK